MMGSVSMGTLPQENEGDISLKKEDNIVTLVENKKHVCLWGDSMIRKVKVVGPTIQCLKMCIPGAKIGTIRHRIADVPISEDVSAIILHVGTNSLVGPRAKIVNISNIIDEYKELLSTARERYPKAAITASGIICRGSYADWAVNEVNDAIADLTGTMDKVFFVDPNAWTGADCLAADHLHLNSHGATKLGSLFCRVLSRKGRE